ncbi:MAG: VOC family protein [Hyphomonadaceae bacterium]|nr:VOC family protein [Hyphomonadaceae bacterium]
MSAGGNFIQITPVMWVPDLEAALAFFTDILGFHVAFKGGGYAYVERETVAVRIMDRTIYADVAPGDRRFAHYIDVRNVDALYAELKPKLDRLPQGDVHGPANKPYGQRELCILAPDGDLVVFGQAIAHG